jgi:hypothetical protein
MGVHMSSNLTQSEHDNTVRAHALRLLSEGYEVRARLEGWFDPPDFINGYRPDIVAKKADRFLILEVEKGEVDWPKLEALKQFKAANPDFDLEVIYAPEIRKTGT